MIAENDDDFEVCATEKDYSIKLTAYSESIPLLGKMFHEFYDDTLTLQWESVEDASTYLVIVEQCIEENCREVLKQFFNTTRFEITDDKFGLCTSYKLQVRHMRSNCDATIESIGHYDNTTSFSRFLRLTPREIKFLRNQHYSTRHQTNVSNIYILSWE